MELRYVELSQVSKARNRKRNRRTGLQAKIEEAKAAGTDPHVLADEVQGHKPVTHSPVIHQPGPEPPTPHAAPSVGPTRRGLSMRGKIGLAAGLTAAGGGGAYLYRRNRLERSLS